VWLGHEMGASIGDAPVNKMPHKVDALKCFSKLLLLEFGAE